jgi:hypothetical protein
MSAGVLLGLKLTIIDGGPSRRERARPAAGLKVSGDGASARLRTSTSIFQPQLQTSVGVQFAKDRTNRRRTGERRFQMPSRAPHTLFAAARGRCTNVTSRIAAATGVNYTSFRILRLLSRLRPSFVGRWLVVVGWLVADRPTHAHTKAPTTNHTSQRSPTSDQHPPCDQRPTHGRRRSPAPPRPPLQPARHPHTFWPPAPQPRRQLILASNHAPSSSRSSRIGVQPRSCS